MMGGLIAVGFRGRQSLSLLSSMALIQVPGCRRLQNSRDRNHQALVFVSGGGMSQKE